MIDGSSASVLSSASAGGQDEHPWLVKSSMTALIGVVGSPESETSCADAGDAKARAVRKVRTMSRRRMEGLPYSRCGRRHDFLLAPGRNVKK